MSREFSVHAVIFERENYVEAQCLEMDVMCSAHSVGEIWNNLAMHVAVNATLAERLHYSMDKAPERYWDAFYEHGEEDYERVPESTHITIWDEEYVIRPTARFIPYARLNRD